MVTSPQLDLFPAVPPRPPVPRIGGTAMPGGVHFSSGNYGTGPSYLLFLTGITVIATGAAAMVLAYVLAWLGGYLTGRPLSDALMGLANSSDFHYLPLVQVGTNLLIFLCFLVVLRVSPMSGYHGAEHKVVHCLEIYGVLDRDLAWTCPRAHRRCGTTLLAGFLPVLLVALPLAALPLWGPPAAVAVVAVCWFTRFRVGAAVQQVFTTKEPTAHQLDTALRAAEVLLERWRRDPTRKLPLWQSLWVRGYPQMVAGVVVAVQVLSWVQVRLPFWVDFTHVLR
jgi:hypothetical protein